MKPVVIRATYSDFRLIKTRQVVSLSFEMPLADWNAVGHEVLGMPQPGSEGWFAIAALQQEATDALEGVSGYAVESYQPAKQAAPAKRSWYELSPTQQAGIRCGEAAFASFLMEEHPTAWEIWPDAAQCVRYLCGVASRTELTFTGPRSAWFALENRYQAWLAKERVGA